MNQLRVGIVGAGMIAGVIAKAIQASEGASLVAVASRRLETAKAFAKEQGIPQTYNTWQEMIESDAVDAIYVATPTSVKEGVAVFAANHKKHILVDKPFASYDSLERITSAATNNSVAFMDATHFVHNPRNKQIIATAEAEIGNPKAVRTSFFFPFMDKTNIRFNPDKEPTGAVGDMAWYSMRAIVEYLNPSASVAMVTGHVERDLETKAVVRGAGIVSFDDGKTSTFDFGYNAGVALMDLDILGDQGMFHLDDFVLDWKHGFAFDNAQHVVGYTKRTGMQAPDELFYIEANSEIPQSVHMVNNFAQLANNPKSDAAKKSIAVTLLTQKLLDSYWNNSN